MSVGQFVQIYVEPGKLSIIGHVNTRTLIYRCLNVQSLCNLHHLIEQLMLILYIANCCYCSQALCTGIEKLTCPKSIKDWPNGSIVGR